MTVKMSRAKRLDKATENSSISVRPDNSAGATRAWAHNISRGCWCCARRRQARRPDLAPRGTLASWGTGAGAGELERKANALRRSQGVTLDCQASGRAALAEQNRPTPMRSALGLAFSSLGPYLLVLSFQWFYFFS